MPAHDLLRREQPPRVTSGRSGWRAHAPTTRPALDGAAILVATDSRPKQRLATPTRPTAAWRNAWTTWPPLGAGSSCGVSCWS